MAAVQDGVPFVQADQGLFRGAGCLDGGATPTGIQNCGSFTGAGMIIGHLCGRTRREGQFEGDARLSHELMREVYERFKKEYGSVLCKDVRKAVKDDCPKVVGRAAQWTAETLLKTFTDYREQEQPT
ncbi:MAG: hypothetical protein A2V70_20285 [Planctomycetes bacterium RBG_13_63_9]|nr:MAG: hypothetical protein A2V70_20285 [Planctomycetes bacterium RBG_13_63_9]